MSTDAPRGASVRASLDRVCIVMMSAVGDAVHVLPVLTALKRHRPDAKVTWILQPGPATLVRGHPDIGDILLFERSNGWRAFNDLRRQLCHAPVRPRPRAAGVPQGGHDHAHGQGAGEAGLRHGPRARHELGVHQRAGPAARDAARAGPVLRVSRCAGRSARRAGVESRAVAARTRAAAWNGCAASTARSHRSWWPPARPQKDWLPERWAAVCDCAVRATSACSRSSSAAARPGNWRPSASSCSRRRCP